MPNSISGPRPEVIDILRIIKTMLRHVWQYLLRRRLLPVWLQDLKFRLSLIVRSLFRGYSITPKIYGRKAALRRLARRCGVLLRGHVLRAHPELPRSDDLDYQAWLWRQEKQHLACAVPSSGPLISILVPTYNTDALYLQRMLASVYRQSYQNWQLCIADDASDQPHVRQMLLAAAAQEPRLCLTLRDENGHISAASDSALQLATGDFIALLDHDDELAANALAEVAELLRVQPDLDFIYSDEDKIDKAGRRLEPYFKPDWSPESLLSRMYTGHLSVYRTALVRELGGFRLGYEGSQDYDLALRMSERTQRIAHIPKILYHWRVHPGSTAMHLGDKDYAPRAGRRALLDALQRRGRDAEVGHVPGSHGHYAPHFAAPKTARVSIIIPTRDQGALLETCLSSLHRTLGGLQWELVIIDHESRESQALTVLESWRRQLGPERLQLLRQGGAFNFSRLVNIGCRQARGDYLLLLNNDTEARQAGWLQNMLAHAQFPEIGAVGARLDYPDRTIQHAGLTLGVAGLANALHRHFPGDDPGYFNFLRTLNNVSAVTGACLLCRKDVYFEVGGFDEELAVAFNDVDFCLKLRSAGYRNLYVPDAVLWHHESWSRGDDLSCKKRQRLAQETELMRKRWGHLLDGDPYYNVNLSRRSLDYSFAD